MAQQLKVTKIRSVNGTNRRTRETLRGLGLKSIGQTVIRPDTPAVRGMVEAVAHLVAWEVVNNGK